MKRVPIFESFRIMVLDSKSAVVKAIPCNSRPQACDLAFQLGLMAPVGHRIEVSEFVITVPAMPVGKAADGIDTWVGTPDYNIDFTYHNEESI